MPKSHASKKILENIVSEDAQTIAPSHALPSSTQNKVLAHTASYMREIGLQHSKEKDYAKALNCHRKALVLHKKESGGEQNEDLAKHYDNLGTVYQATSAANRAASYFHKALTIRLNLHGQDHILTAGSFDRIGDAYFDQGDYDRALNFHHKAKHVKKKLLGRDHAKTAKSFWNIGNVHYMKKDYDEALEYFHKALDVQGRVFDSDHHPDKVATRESIGMINKAMSKKP